jgi:hypothetical protein
MPGVDEPKVLVMRPTMWKAVATLASVGAAIATRHAAAAVWRKRTGHDPPTNPADTGTDWGEAVAWTLVTGALVGVARLVARRGAARVWAKVEGELPSEQLEMA